MEACLAMPRGEKKIFECVICSDTFSMHSLSAGEYFVQSGVCKDCYEKMQKKPASVSCFGKLPNGRMFGYTSSNPVCSTICPDRGACLVFISKLKNS